MSQQLEPANGSIRVLILDDHKLFGEALAPLLEEQGMEVLPIATREKEARELASQHQPDVVLVDLHLADAWGVDVGRRMLNDLPDAKVIALTSANDPKAVQEALRAGFHGYLTKDTPLNRFFSSLAAAMDGQVVVPHQLARSAAGDRSPEERHAALLAEQLTSREFEVLRMLVEGLPAARIAKTLCISPNTVRTHVQNILTKLQVHSRLEAVAFAVRYDLVNGRGGTRAAP